MLFKNPKINFFFVFVLAFLSITVFFAIIFGGKDPDNVVTKHQVNKADSQASAGVEGVDELRQLNKDVVARAKHVAPGTVPGIAADDYYLGKLDYPVEMIVYCDFKSELCADYQATIEKVKNEFGDRVTIAFRNFFLANRNPSRKAAIAAVCAGEQDAFWEMHDELFNNYVNTISSNHYSEIAAKINIDILKFDSCLQDEKYSEEIDKQISEAVQQGVLGVPSTFINGEKLPGSYAYDDFKDSSGREREGLRSVILKKLGD